MGERIAEVVIGAYLEDLPPCLHENGWGEWVHTQPELKKQAFNGVQFRTDYESRPSWMGFAIKTLEYMETCAPVARDSDRHMAAVYAWDALRRLVRDRLSLELPTGYLIIALDQ